ncbi:hypothetical protein M0812_16174 [Anaeramoeba flamelloides]|uniref:Uncharacterized protein n=1 Tax=Anaeramoeba flamelloides TaxID=1746091 RepID=A0AAV7ZGB8_9EUKA|nr:hypothetical protein M0812_16174 [Anaeramoeba flamelloides]
MDPHSKKARTLDYVSNKKVIQPLFPNNTNQPDKDRQLSSTNNQVLRTNENLNQNQTTNEQTEKILIENIVIENNPKKLKEEEETNEDLKQNTLRTHENNDQKELQIQVLSSQRPNSEQNQEDEKVNQQVQEQKQEQKQEQEQEKEQEKENEVIKIEITTKKQQKIELIQEKPNEQLVSNNNQEDQEKENNGIVEFTNSHTSNVSTIKIITSQKQQNNLNGIQILKSNEEDSSRKRNLEEISNKINKEPKITNMETKTKTKTKRNTISLIQIAPKRSKFILPKGWEHTPRMGKKVEQTNIIPLKTPLDEK